MKHTIIALAIATALTACGEKQPAQAAAYPQTPVQPQAQAIQPQAAGQQPTQIQVAGQPVGQAAPVQYVQQPAPTVIIQQPAQQVQQHDNTAGNLLTGAAAGYMLSQAMNNNERRPTYDELHRYDRVSQPAPVTNTIVREKVIIKEKLVQAPPAPTPAPKTVQVQAKTVNVQPAGASKWSQPTTSYKQSAPTYTYKSTTSSSSKR